MTARAPPRPVARPAVGFTLVELLITLALLGLLAGAAATLSEAVTRRAQEQELRVALRQLREAIDAYKRAADAGRLRKAADETGYPRSLAELVEGVPDQSSPAGAKLYFLRRLPRDPMADAELAAERGWGLRSYASDPQDPRAGRDVFDVHSRSGRIGMDGRAYREW